MQDIKKNYYTISELSKIVEYSYSSLIRMVRAIKVTVLKQNNNLCVRAEDIPYIKRCIVLMGVSRMNYAFLSRFTKKEIKLMIAKT